MRGFPNLVQSVATCFLALTAHVGASNQLEERWNNRIAPKVFLIDMFPPEGMVFTLLRWTSERLTQGAIIGSVWYGIKEFDLLAKNITVPGLSPLYPDVHCTKDYQVCQVVTGESGTRTKSNLDDCSY